MRRRRSLDDAVGDGALMERAISGYHLDEEGDWVAELACGHNQHVRHRPPFQLRPWVLEAGGRAARLGSPLDCPLCDRAELPDGLRLARTTAVWDEHSLPSGLRREHRVAPGTWGRVVVHTGSLRFRAATDPPIDVVVDPSRAQPIPPEVAHQVEPLGPVSVAVEFYAVDRTADRGATVAAPTAVPEEEQGGDPACWSHLVSEETGTIDGGEAPRR